MKFQVYLYVNSINSYVKSLKNKSYTKKRKEAYSFSYSLFKGKRYAPLIKYGNQIRKDYDSFSFKFYFNNTVKFIIQFSLNDNPNYSIQVIDKSFEVSDIEKIAHLLSLFYTYNNKDTNHDGKEEDNNEPSSSNSDEKRDCDELSDSEEIFKPEDISNSDGLSNFDETSENDKKSDSENSKKKSVKSTKKLSKEEEKKMAMEFILESCIREIESEGRFEIVKSDLTLNDYICNPNLKDELISIKNQLIDREKYKSFGITIPKGYLLYGPAGTGKSYAAKCIAGSIDGYFISTSGSSLQNMYVGSGANIIRNLFKNIRKLSSVSQKGVILFIDEIDSLGYRGQSKDNVEGTRTINQLLTELSGINTDDNIIVIAATNFLSNIDNALTRPGRLSKQILIEYPSDEVRKSLLSYYLSKCKLPLQNISIDTISDLSVGLSSAGISELINNSAIIALKSNQEVITVDNINEAIDNIITKSSRNQDDTENLELIASHEIGHVLAEIIYSNSYPIKVSTYSYGTYGGFTQSGKILEGLNTKEEYLNEIKVLLAGRAAESVLCNKITSGATSDIARAKDVLYDYYNTCLFEKYCVSQLDQTIFDRINELYEEVLNDFNTEYNKYVLTALKEKLIKKRVLYKAELEEIVSSLNINIPFNESIKALQM